MRCVRQISRAGALSLAGLVLANAQATGYQPIDYSAVDYSSVDTQSNDNTLAGNQPASTGTEPMGVFFINNNSMPHHISADWAKDDREQYPNANELNWGYAIVGPGEQIFVPGLPQTSPKFLVGTTPNNHTEEIGDKRDHDTAVEMTFKGGYDWLYYDVDIERGFSAPVWCHGQGMEWETGQGCTADLLAACPESLRHYDADTGIYDQCRGSETQESLLLRKTMCPMTYVKYNDDERTNVTNGKHGMSSALATLVV